MTRAQSRAEINLQMFPPTCLLTAHSCTALGTASRSIAGLTGLGINTRVEYHGISISQRTRAARSLACFAFPFFWSLQSFVKDFKSIKNQYTANTSNIEHIRRDNDIKYIQRRWIESSLRKAEDASKIDVLQEIRLENGKTPALIVTLIKYSKH